MPRFTHSCATHTMHLHLAPFGRTARKAVSALAAAALCCTGAIASALIAAPTANAAPKDYHANTSDFAPDSDVVVIAFQQNWNSIAKECTDVLGPEGVGYVEVSPPMEEIPGSQWWTSYQPVSYKLDSKEGTEAEFQNMIDTCKAAGVGVVADAITNHMAAAPQDGSKDGTGVAGSTYTSDGDFPAVPWTKNDFHTCTKGVSNYKDATNVQECQLDGLQDLNTGSDHVQDVLADYLAKLYSMGVVGFRMDAIKHIASADVLAIKQKMAQKLGIGIDDIWWMQEVIDDDGQAAELAPSNYFQTGDVSEFQYSYALKSAFGLSVTALKKIGTTANLIDSNKAQVFVSNWDTERGSQTLSYKDGKKYILANAFMLAYGYGTPNIQSGYVFANRDDGAPGATDTSIPDTQCGTGSPWLCVERWTQIRGMIRFHNNTNDGTIASNWWDDGANTISFSKNGLGFFAMNASSKPVTYTFSTTLPAGEYCNLYGPGDCSSAVKVADDGTASITIDSMDAVAIDNVDTPQTWGADNASTAATDPSDPPLTSSGAFDASAIDMTFGGVYGGDSQDSEKSSDQAQSDSETPTDPKDEEGTFANFGAHAVAYAVIFAIVLVFSIVILVKPNTKSDK